ncbi:MAG: DUF4114 domain-containing protein [Planctomycetota bacterium]|nr:DUF4114 domain-containing protein [Planctomycetota bacterium]
MKKFCMMVAAGVLAASSLPAMAGYTTVGAPASGEKSMKEILEAVYGGTFTPSGVDFSNGTVTATRVNDNGGSGTNDALFGPGLADDQVWNGGALDAKVDAVYAGFTQNFGYKSGTASTAFNSLFTVTGTGLAVTGSASIDMATAAGGTWRWARTGNDGRVFTSRDSDNVDAVDHMITYEITGASDIKTWLIGIEDNVIGRSDRDFNDLVVQVQAVPTPAAVGMGLTTLAGMGIAALRRKRKQA